MAGRTNKAGGFLENLLRFLGGDIPSDNRHGLQGMKPRAKSNRAAAVDVDRFKETSGVGQDWARTVYGGYYATCVPVYAAIKIRSDALARTPLMVLRSSSFNAGGALSDDSGHSPGGTGTGRERRDVFTQREPVGEAHPVEQLLTRANK